MKDVQVKEVMIPLSNYVTVKKTNTLVEVLKALEDTRQSDKAHAHRDAIVVDDNQAFIGKITMIDIFRALEPNYQKIDPDEMKGVLSKEFVMKAVRQFNLWVEPIQDLCERGGKLTVSDVMYVPEQNEYIQENETLEKALNQYVMGVHQPLIVKSGDQVTGVLRFGDLFEVVRHRMLSCTLETK